MSTESSLQPPTNRVERSLWNYVQLRDGDYPSDWNRFYTFIVIAHVARVGWDANDVKARMVRYGLSPDKAKEMAEVYWHGRCVLRVHSKWTHGSEYVSWVRKDGMRVT